jgi:gliding motility-associated-like protein
MKIASVYKYLFLVLIAMLVSFNATPQVSADFTIITSAKGCGSLVVEFKDLSLGNPTAWLWDFGNGNTSTLQHPVATYSTPGLYDVVLTVSNMIVDDTKDSSSLIEIYEYPVAELETNIVANGCAPLNITFNDLSSSGATIISWEWDFGDGGSSSLQNPDYTYLNSGVYSVSLYVLDNNGCQNLATEIDLIEVDASPNANFSSNISFSCDSIHEVEFFNSSISSSSFIWDFGDGITSSIMEPSHLFTTGIYSVSLYAIDGSCIDTLVMTDLIKIVGAFAPDFTVSNNSGCEGVNINFSDQSVNNTTTWLWDFGDGTTSILQNPLHVFDSAGVFDVTLTTSISDQCVLSTTFPSEIEVFSKPNISFFSDTNLGCSIPFDVSFYDNTIDALYWSWDFGDGNFSNIKDPSNTYFFSGLFDVSLSVENNNGCTSSIMFSDYLRIDEAPVLSLSAAPLVSCSGESISFSDLSNFGINDWEWSFGDGNISDSQHPIHQYNLPGLYDVSLIGGINLCKDTIVIVDYISIIEPAAYFEENYNCDHPLKVEFENLSVGADSIFWDFGDGFTSTLLNPIHSFANLGIHIVSLSVINNITGCEHVFLKEIELTNPIANFDYIIDPNNGHKDSSSCIPDRMYIDNQSQDWAFMTTLWGDGGVQYGPSHIYATAGVFDVTLIVSDIHDCKDTMTIENMITMHDINVDFEASNMFGCDSFFVEFDAFYDTSLSFLEWDFGDGTGSTINSPQHIYYNEGVYDVKLYAESIYGCRDTVTNLEYINFQKPIASYSSNIQNVCKGDQVIFSNLSVGNGISFIWDFGDGISSNMFNPNHEYILAGTYDINLLVTDSFGCYDNLSLSNYIEVMSPSADFSSSVLSSNCPPLISNFINLSSSDAISFRWSFGDGYYSLVDNPSHLFLSSGLFDVSLTVEDVFGCKDSLIKVSNVNMLGVMPTGSFEVSKTSLCKDNTVSFLPVVTNVSSFFWDFGNGEVSYDSVASTIYSDSGTFVPTLIVENSSGCQLTINSEDTIKVSDIFVDAGLDMYICEGESVELNAVGNGYLFDWSPVDGLSSTGIHNPQAFPILSRFYYVTHTDGLCTAVDSLFITVHNDVPNAAFTAANLCDSDSTYFEANSGLVTNNNSYIWSFGKYGNVVNSVLNVGGNNIVLIVENLNNSCKDTLEKNIQIFESPIADFSMTEACFGDSVFFSDNSSINVSNWVYDFGDGIASSTNQHPIYAYLNHGFFNVQLNVVSDMGCEDSIVKEIVVYENPIADFSSDIQHLCVGDDVQFSNHSIGEGINTIWDFGNGLSSSLLNPNHTFLSNGMYDINLLVTDSFGCSNNVELSNYIKVLSPTANFTNLGLALNCNPVIIDFMNLSNPDVSIFKWDFGDSLFSLIENPSHLFSNSGLFNVSLIVENTFGCQDTLVKIIEVFESPIADFLVEDVCFGDSLVFLDNSFADSTAIWNYDFGDGIGFSLDPNPSCSYSEPGVYNVLLSLTNEMGCADSLIKEVVVNDLPIANFSIENKCEGEGNIFIDSSLVNNSSIALIEYNFNDGSFSNDSIAVHVFNGFGSFEVELTVTTLDGCSSSKIKQAEVFASPIVDFSSSQFCEKEQTIFSDDSFVPEGNVASYNWTFGLEGSSNNKSTTHIFSSHGFFDVSLFVISDRGCEGILNKEIEINKNPSVDFQIPSDICLGEIVDILYVSKSNEDVESWNYSFGDGSFSNDMNPSHTYEYIDSFDISLEVLSSEGCRNDTIIVDVIEVHEFPVADFQPSKLFASELSSEISFYNNSEGATYYEWDFDNGEYSFEESPVFRFYDPHSYDVSLTVTNDFGCSSRMVKTIQINPEYTFFVPDAFTPDGNGVNDVFKPEGNRISSFEMQVFNRWGDIVFESSMLDFGWDGYSSSGEELSRGVYMYHIEVYDLNERPWVYNGEIRLMR